MIDFLNKYIFRRKIFKKKKDIWKIYRYKRLEMLFNYIYEYMNRELFMEDGIFINMYLYLFFLNINIFSLLKNIRIYFVFWFYLD